MAKSEPIVSSVGTVAGSFVGVTALVVIFAGEHAWVLAPIALAFAILGLGAIWLYRR